MDLSAFRAVCDELVSRFPPSVRDLDRKTWLLLGAGAAGATALYWWYSCDSRLNLPPGPRRWPFVGNSFQIDGPMYKWIWEQSKIYGPLMYMTFGPFKCVMICSTELAHQAFVENPKHFSGRPSSYSGDKFSSDGKSISLGQFTPIWALQRKLFLSAIRNYASGSILGDSIDRAAAISVDELMKCVDAGAPIDLHQYIGQLVYNNTCAAAYGKTYELNDPDFRRTYQSETDLLESFASGVLLVDMVPILRYLPSLPDERKAAKLVADLLKFNRDAWASHQENFDADNLRDFTDHLIDAWHKEQDALNSQLTEEHFVQILMDLFVNGVDSSLLILYWFFHYMVVYTEVQAKCQAEIDRVTGGRAPDMRDRLKLPYLEAALLEAVYHSGLLGVGVPRRVDGDTKLAGYDIPDGVMVLLNHWAILREHASWTPDYTPERHLTADGQLASRPPGFFPFGLGKRTCPGEALGKTNIVLLSAKLIHQFSFSAADEESRDISPDPKVSIAAPSRRFKVIIKSRQA